jgi:ABC-2 type transport system permease protein
MTWVRKVFPAYVASFAAGWRQAAGDRADLVSTLLVYAVLLLVFNTVYAVMPVEELGVPGLTRHHLLWYFTVTECITCSEPGFSLFGRMIGEGRLTEMMQRPVNILGMFVTRHLGAHVFYALVLFAFACVTLPFCAGARMTMDLSFLPWLAVSVIFGMILFETMAYMVGTVEVLGPYSRPLSWIVGKFIFSFGGLFFPVSFFPPLVQKIALLTPFPSVISTPGEFMLMPDAATIARGLLMQVFWIAIMIPLAVLSERRMLCRVLEKGD